MDTNPSKLRFQEQNQTTEQQHTRPQQATQEFRSVEELLRHDAAQVTPPPTLYQRLLSSIRNEPAPRRRWWQRLFAWRSPEP